MNLTTDFELSYPVTAEFVGLSPIRPVMVRTKFVGWEDELVPTPERGEYPRHIEVSPMLSFPDINPHATRPIAETRIRDVMPHTHEYSEVFIIFGGEALHESEYFTAPLQTGSAAFVPPGHSHAITGCRNLIISNIGYLSPWIITDQSDLRAGDIPPGYFAAELFNGAVDGAIEQAELDRTERTHMRIEVEHLAHELARERPAHTYLKSCLLKLLVVLSRASLRERQSEPKLPFREEIWKALEEVESAIVKAESFNVASLAAQMGLSEGHFSRLFKRHTGKSPQGFYQGRRIQYACQMLCNPSMSVTEIAHRLGFASCSHFNEVFRRYMGKTPTHYRSNRDRNEGRPPGSTQRSRS